jgi:hypothetical protein
MTYAEAIAEIVKAERAYDALCDEFLDVTKRLHAAKVAVDAAREQGRAVTQARFVELDHAIGRAK